MKINRLPYIQAGFTLIEVIISILLLSVMAFSIIKITDQSTKTKLETIKEDNDFLRIYSAFYTIQWDFNHLYTPLVQNSKINTTSLAPNINETEEEKQLFSEFERDIIAKFRNNKRFSGITESGELIPKILFESNHTITFLSNGYRRKNLNEKKSNLAWITYTLEDPSTDDVEALKEKEQKEDVKAGKNLVRYIDAINPFSTDPTSKDDLFPQVIFEKVVSIEWSFWDRAKKSFASLDNINEEKQPITAFKVKIVFYDIYDQEQTLEKIFPTNFNESEIAKRLRSQRNNRSNTQTNRSNETPGGSNPQGGVNE
jgi:prepilin-type N-terminal cleavage/methylation domain-containing protein